MLVTTLKPQGFSGINVSLNNPNNNINMTAVAILVDTFKDLVSPEPNSGSIETCDGTFLTVTILSLFQG